jgi:hypothetical protein
LVKGKRVGVHNSGCVEWNRQESERVAERSDDNFEAKRRKLAKRMKAAADVLEVSDSKFWQSFRSVFEARDERERIRERRMKAFNQQRAVYMTRFTESARVKAAHAKWVEEGRPPSSDPSEFIPLSSAWKKPSAASLEKKTKEKVRGKPTTTGLKRQGALRRKK